jgi:hypothetical protein
VVEAAAVTLITGITGGGAIVGAIVANLAISAIIGKILAPDIPTDSRDTKGLQQTIRSNIAPRRVCYGEAMAGGPYILLETTGTDNQFLNFNLVITGHPIEDVLGVYLDDEYINIAGVGGATNTSSGTNDLDTNYYVDAGKYGTGEAAGHVRIIKVLGFGYADNTYVTNEGSFQPAIDDRARSALIRDHITTEWTQPSVGTRDSGTGLYGTGYKVTNCAYIMFSLKYNRDVYSNIPRIRLHIKGKRLYNPALDSSLAQYGADSSGTHDINDGETWEYSTNWALGCFDLLINNSYGLGAKTSGDLVEVNWTEMIQAINDADDQVSNGYDSPDEETVDRYTLNGIFEVSGTPISNMEALLTSGAGILIYAQGMYALRAGKYRAPSSDTDIINEDMIRSGLTIRTHAPRSEIFNKVAGVYVEKGPDAAPIFEPSDFPIVDPLDSSGLNPYEVIDDEEIIQELDFPFTIHEFEAQRLARIALERSRQGLVIQFDANLEVLKYSVGDNIYLEILSDSKYNNRAFYNRLGLDDRRNI